MDSSSLSGLSPSAVGTQPTEGNTLERRGPNQSPPQLVSTNNIRSWKWVNSPNDTFNTTGIHTGPLSSFLDVYEGGPIPPTIQHLADRRYKDDEDNNTEKDRFSVMFLNTKKLNESCGRGRWTSSDLAMMRVQRIYEKTLCANNSSMEVLSLPGSFKDVPKRSKEDMKHIITHPDTIHIVVLGVHRAAGYNDPTLHFYTGSIAAITFCPAGSNNILINLCGTVPNLYNNSYGEKNDNRSFRQRGLMSLLVKLACSFHNSRYQTGI